MDASVITPDVVANYLAANIHDRAEVLALHAAVAVACAAGVRVFTERPASICALGSGIWRLRATLLWIRHAIAGFGDVAPAGRGFRVGR